MTDLLGPEGLAELSRFAAARALVVLDFDGTLAPIVARRERAAMSARTRALLAAVAVRYPCAVLSGRSLADLRARLDGVPVRWLVGSHGADTDPPGSAVAREDVARWLAPLRAAAAAVPGAEVEDKGLSVALHYRGAADAPRARRLLLDAARGLPGTRVGRGKRVLNVVSAAAPDKGHALAALVRAARAEAVLFAGDDETDEDAFGRELGVPAITARVGGRRRSRARYRLAGRACVDRLLAELVRLRPSGA